MKRRILGLVLALSMLMAFVPIMASAERGTKYGDYLYYEIDSYNNAVTITDCDDTATEVVIPSEINGLPVTSIGPYAFHSCKSLANVTIPESVTSIGGWSFMWCESLTSITIPDSVTSIGFETFGGCSSLTSITIPDTISNIGYDAFRDTAYYNNEANWVNGLLYINNYLIDVKTDITECIIKDDCTVIATATFRGCSSLTSVTLPDSITSIAFDMFFGCSALTSITIPDSVTSIESGVFGRCNALTSITLPDSLSSISSNAFKDTAYYSNESNWLNGLLYINNYLIGVKSGITECTITDNCTIIAGEAFNGCSALTSVIIPDSVTAIGNGAFNECSALTNITIPDSVTAIESGAFSGCSALTSITIPDSVTSIAVVKEVF